MITKQLTQDLNFLCKRPEVRKMVHFGSSYFDCKNYADIDIAIFLNEKNKSGSIKSLISSKFKNSKIDNYKCYDRNSLHFDCSKYHFVIVPSDYDRNASIIESIEKGISIVF